MTDRDDRLRSAVAVLSGRYCLDFQRSPRDGFVEVSATMPALEDVRDDLQEGAADVELVERADMDLHIEAIAGILFVKPGEEQLAELVEAEREARPDDVEAIEDYDELADRFEDDRVFVTDEGGRLVPDGRRRDGGTNMRRSSTSGDDRGGIEHLRVLGAELDQDVSADDLEAAADAAFFELADRGVDVDGVAPVVNSDVRERMPGGGSR